LESNTSGKARNLMGIDMAKQMMKAGVMLGGIVVGGAIVLTATAGLAFAAPHSVATPGDAAGRPSLGNVAPGVRAAQGIGDSVFNNSTAFNSALNSSPAGMIYHSAFGTRGTIVNVTDVNGNVIDRTYDPDHGNGSNGFITGALNAPIGTVVGGVIPIKECNIKRNVNGTGIGVQPSPSAQQCSTHP
jgi:hypothetical protein